jgi:hypothetical protein
VIKVMIVFYGLVMFVPQNWDRGLTVLFMDGGDHGGVRHVPTLQVVEEDGEPSDPWELGGLVEINIQGPPGDVDPHAQAYFVQLEDLFAEQDDGMVRKECVDNDPSCQENTSDPVLIRAVIKGEWSTSPATHCNDGWSMPVEFDDIARFQFRKYEAGSPRPADTRRLATALRLDTEVSTRELKELLSLKEGEYAELTTIEGPQCNKWIGGDVQECVVLLIGNKYSIPAAKRPYDALDKHFTAFYRVAVTPPQPDNRWLPYIFSNSSCPPDYPIPNPPAVRCPPPFATAEE